MTSISARPPDEMYRTGLQIEASCARCGSSVHSERCDECEDGYDGHDCGSDCCDCRYPDDNVPCMCCDGTGVYRTCMSSPEWCQANPLAGREDVVRGAVEWYTVEEHDR